MKSELAKSGIAKFGGTWPAAARLIRPFRWHLAAALLLLTGNRIAGLVLPASTKYVVDALLHPPGSPPVGVIVAVVAIATAIQAATAWALTTTLGRASQKIIADFRKQLQKHVLRLAVEHHDSVTSGALAARIMNDADGLRNLVGAGMVELAGGVLTAAVAFAVMLRLDVALTVVLAAILAVFAWVARRAFVALRPLSRQRATLYSDLTGRLTEWMAGVRAVKAYRAEARGDELFAAGIDSLTAKVLRAVAHTATLNATTAGLVGSSAIAVIWVSSREVAAGRMTVGSLFSFIAFLGFLVMPLLQVISIASLLSDAIAGLERSESLLRLPREEHDPQRILPMPHGAGDIAFENVTFAYPGRPAVLENISFRVSPGTTTALVGSSGAGKSTILSLLAAFYAPQAGRVLVDGADICRVKLAAYRAAVGLVTQDTFLFDGSICDNVRLGRNGAERETVVAACRAVGVDTFAEALPSGYDTMVGERGLKLSGGQRQRLALARAVLSKPKILLLDEPTSNLDAESEALVQQAVAAVMSGMTTVVVAHRLSTIRNADQILVLEQGRIVERGTHESLMAARGRYFELYERQATGMQPEAETRAVAAAAPVALGTL